MEEVGVVKRASLPLYGLSELRAPKTDFWRAVRAEFERAGGRNAPLTLDFTQPIVPACIEPRTLFTQVCGYPLQKLFRSQVTVLAAPVYDATYCEAATHCGVFVVHRDAPYLELADLRACRFLFGGPSSNSGMNLPRRVIAELASGAPFFSSAAETDSQAGNLELVARGKADATCVDCVTYAFVVRHRPHVAASTRVLALTPRSPSIPFVTASATDPTTVQFLRRALNEVAAAPEWADARAGLLLRDIVPIEAADYDGLLDYEQQAIALSYPVLC